MALKSCIELDSPMSLRQFIVDRLLPFTQLGERKIIFADCAVLSKEDRDLLQWMDKDVIVCTEGGLDLDKEIVRLSHFPHQVQKGRYVDLLQEVVKELLMTDKREHLQTYGYQMD